MLPQVHIFRNWEGFERLAMQELFPGPWHWLPDSIARRWSATSSGTHHATQKRSLYAQSGARRAAAVGDEREDQRESGAG